MDKWLDGLRKIQDRQTNWYDEVGEWCIRTMEKIRDQRISLIAKIDYCRQRRSELEPQVAGIKGDDETSSVKIVDALGWRWDCFQI